MRKEVAIIAAFLLAFVGTFVTRCAYAEPILQVSAGHTVLRANAPALDLTMVWPGSGPKGAETFCGISLVGDSVENNNPLPSQASLHCGVANHYGPLWLGLGVTYLQNVDYVNSAHFNFQPQIQYTLSKHLSLLYRHWSNAGTVRPNRGRDMLYVSYRL